MNYPKRNPSRPAPNVARQAEKLQALVADRGTTSETGREDQRAVRVGDLSGYGSLDLKSAYAAGAAPTAAEHDALVNDMRALGGLLRSLGANITW